MTNKQKHLLAYALLAKATELIEYWDESSITCELVQAGIDPADAAQQLANWLRSLPGTDWPRNLPQPK